MGFSVVCRGSRGSSPVSGFQFHRYGGATTCFEVALTDNHRLLIDAGTGALNIGPVPAPSRFSILLTHLHWDHTQALPFFAPLYDSRNRFDFYGHRPNGIGIEDALNTVMQPPYFPVSFRSAPSDKRFHHLDGQPLKIDGYSITYAHLFHPQGVTGYRLEKDGAVLVIATDVEHGEAASDDALRDLAAGADVLIYDAQYHPEEWATTKKGWGHSTWEAAADLAKAAGAKRLLLTSHDPSRTDEEIDAICDLASRRFPNTQAVAEGMVVEVGNSAAGS
jgi:phosphoribosyl 1,2-cyclic phosphodiesterase